MAYGVPDSAGGMVNSLRWLVFAAVAAAVSCSPAAADPVVWPTNLHLLQQGLAQAATEAVAAMPDTIRRVRVSVDPAENTVATSSVVQALLDSGREVVVPDDSTATHLRIHVAQAAVTIPDTERMWLVGRRIAHRRADIELQTVLFRRDSIAIWTLQTQAVTEDRVPVSALPVVKGPAGLNLDPAVPDERWQRYAEPALVSGVIAAVLYLFFTK